MKIKETIPYIIIIILGSLLISKCNPTPDPTPDNIVEETKIEYIRDTIYVPKYITIKETQSIVKRDENNVYDSSKHSTTYYNQTFKDSMYVLNTFGGYVDSINLSFKCEDKIIYDSTIINTTKTITNTVFKPFKNTLGIEYIYNIDNNVIVDYTRNFNRVGLSVGLGMNINSKVPLAKVGFKYHFNGK